MHATSKPNAGRLYSESLCEELLFTAAERCRGDVANADGMHTLVDVLYVYMCLIPSRPGGLVTKSLWGRVVDHGVSLTGVPG